MHSIRLVPALAALCLVAVAGPSGALAQSPSTAPLTLTLAIANDQGEPSQPAIDAFIGQVAEQSGGSIVIEPLYGAGNATQEGFEAGVAGLVERGEADLGLNASRAWDLMGVTSLQALQAPFLITDGALATAVATSDIATRALAGMADKGVTGLTLWPEDLRHPFALGTHAPFLTPDDFAGADILVQPSALSRSLITTLGGTLYVDGDREADAASGLLQGAESGLLQGATLPGHPTATGDVTFYPKFQVISANSARFDALTQQQQAILRSAAAETQRLTIAAHTSEADAAAAWCANGGSVVLAGADGVAAFEAAARPVFDALGKDPLTATLVSDIGALKAKTPAAPGATACNAVVASPSPVASQSGAAGTMEFDTDRPGQDYFDFDLLSAMPELCDQACRSDPNCKAWTYVKPNTIQGPNARCWLKDGIPDAISNSCCISGLAAEHPVQTSGPTATGVLGGTWHTDKLSEDQVVAAFVARGGTESEGHDFFAQLGGGAKEYAVIGIRFLDGRITGFESGDGRPEVDSFGASPTYDVSAEGLLTIHGAPSASHFTVSMLGDQLSLAALDPCPTDCHPYGETLIASFPFHRDAAAATAIDGTYTTSFTREELASSPQLEDQMEINNGNWGDFTLTFDNGTFTGTQSNSQEHNSGTGTYTVNDDLVAWTVNGETFGFRWSIVDDILTFRRDPAYAGPTPFLVKSWTRLP